MIAPRLRAINSAAAWTIATIADRERGGSLSLQGRARARACAPYGAAAVIAAV